MAQHARKDWEFEQIEVRSFLDFGGFGFWAFQPFSPLVLLPRLHNWSVSKAQGFSFKAQYFSFNDPGF